MFLKEIYRRTKIKFNTKKDIFFKEAFNIPTEKRFYNKIFTLYFYDRNLVKPPPNNLFNNIYNNAYNNNIISNNLSQQNNNYNNISNNNFVNYFNNNNNFSAYTNNYNTNEKVHLKGHTGFF